MKTEIISECFRTILKFYFRVCLRDYQKKYIFGGFSLLNDVSQMDALL